MKRDIDLLRKILFTIEDQYQAGEGSMLGLQIEGYDVKVIAEHCDLLYQQGLIAAYKDIRGDDTIQAFMVGNLSSAGYDYLELIRNDDVWSKTKEEVKEKKLPATIEWLAQIAGIITGRMLKEIAEQ